MNCVLDLRNSRIQFKMIRVSVINTFINDNYFKEGKKKKKLYSKNYSARERKRAFQKKN